jgi:hypothetical protein
LRLNKPVLLIVCASILLLSLKPALGWSNGGYSADTAHPDYGTHDWIAQHALDFLPANEKQYIVDNLAGYLYGTELPDRPSTQGGIGDTTKHHIYYYSNGTLQDDASAKRAREEYQNALTYLKNKDYANAAKKAGTLTHYIDDMAVFSHMMGAKTSWGTEVHHSDYETHVNGLTPSYTSGLNVYLHFDGALVTVSAYDAAKNLAYDITFGNGSYGCSWMDTNYNWNNPTFTARSEESLNNAVNTVADVLHTLYQEANPTVTPTQTPTATPTLTPQPTSSQLPVTPEYPIVQAIFPIMASALLLAVLFQKRRQD